MSLNEAAHTRFAELKGSGASDRVLARLRHIIDQGSDFDCYKVNAFRLAEEAKSSRVEAVRALLFATRVGLFDLNWDIYCPSCGGMPEFHKHLMELKDRSHCPLCVIDFSVQFDEQVEVTFTVNPDVRKLAILSFAERKTLQESMQWFTELREREGRAPAVGALMSPGEQRTIETDLAAGHYSAWVPSHIDRMVKLEVTATPRREPVVDVNLSVGSDGAITLSHTKLHPGPTRFHITYGYPKLWGIAINLEAPQRNWVSAAYLSTQQDFRDLFAGEFLSPDANFAVRSVTLMFSDIRGSTEMYEQLGDARAYAIVKEHFTLMTEIIRRHEGGIVKTIGDAVMAAFPVNADAVRAACEIQRAFAVTPDPLRTVEVKIGLHRGPAIMVTSNRAVDYFGRTVNVAARAQGAAEPRQVLLTDQVLADPLVRALVEQLPEPATTFEAKVKGVARPLRLHALRCTLP